MNIQEFVDVCKKIALEKIDCRSFYVGNTWDMSNTKGDIYPNCWFEMPILVEYQITTNLSKQFTVSLDFLTLAKPDNPNDELLKISEMEDLSDLFLYYLKQNADFKLTGLPTGLTLRQMNSDNACGVRIDIRVNTGRKCLK